MTNALQCRVIIENLLDCVCIFCQNNIETLTISSSNVSSHILYGMLLPIYKWLGFEGSTKFYVVNHFVQFESLFEGKRTMKIRYWFGYPHKKKTGGVWGSNPRPYIYYMLSLPIDLSSWGFTYYIHLSHIIYRFTITFLFPYISCKRKQRKSSLPYTCLSVKKNWIVQENIKREKSVLNN